MSRTLVVISAASGAIFSTLSSTDQNSFFRDSIPFLAEKKKKSFPERQVNVLLYCTYLRCTQTHTDTDTLTHTTLTNTHIHTQSYTYTNTHTHTFYSRYMSYLRRPPLPPHAELSLLGQT